MRPTSEFVARMKQLRALLSYEDGLPFHFYAHNLPLPEAAELGKITTLKYLSLHGPLVTDGHLEYLAPLVNLEGLSFSETGIAGAGLRALNCQKLTELDLSRSSITGTGLRALNCPTLVTLRLQDCRNIDDEACAVLPRFPTLQQLYLDRTSITRDGLRHLAPLLKLESLHLAGTKITDDGMKYIGALPKLKYLEIYDTAISDAGIMNLTETWELQEIATFDITRLRSDPKFCHVTPEGYKRLMTKLPKLRIAMIM